jgi:lipopolysaccharide/colanic/teichoic acid biosynthesis glycosyltransferase
MRSGNAATIAGRSKDTNAWPYHEVPKEVPAAVMTGRAQRPAYAIAKRALDLGLGILSLAVAALPMIAIAIAIKLESKGPVFFGHTRVGRYGKRFCCLKFRTMRPGAEKELETDLRLKTYYNKHNFKIPVERDPRVTRLGRFLRKTSLDELPQLFNVIGGSMSLVGPRPIVPEELHWYREHLDLFLSVRPGITGVWQVHGRSCIGYPDRVQVELAGIRHSSFWHDLVLLAKTVPAVVTGRGAE